MKSSKISETQLTKCGRETSELRKPTDFSSETAGDFSSAVFSFFVSVQHMHTIRLRRPWKLRQGVQESTVDVPDNTRHDRDTCTTAEYRRRFNAPTGLDADSSVELCFAGWSSESASIELNDEVLLNGPTKGIQFPIRLPIRSFLQGSNELVVRLNAAADTPVLSGEVSIEIES